MKNGFYKKDNGCLLYGTQIENKNYTLIIEDILDYSLPIDGWFYFENEETARESLNCPIIEDEIIDEVIDV